MKSPIEVLALWDQEAEVWTATSDQVPGLAIEAETIEDLVRRLKVVIPELLELNQLALEDEEIVFHLRGERSEALRLRRHG
ncbi:MAG: DUF1902 domain-containing protein [Methylohalobius sp. ZOD2]|uniref:DUF1902 domain-containing protein n=1 Tax=Methylohalobius crimeensis TaxID=244365 RepID=UPI0003B73ED0|nr:DUF1902 domain-containing protein [Methylohalobius crimeensis]